MGLENIKNAMILAATGGNLFPNFNKGYIEV